MNNTSNNKHNIILRKENKNEGSEKLGRICEVQKNSYKIRFFEEEIPAKLKVCADSVIVSTRRNPDVLSWLPLKAVSFPKNVICSIRILTQKMKETMRRKKKYPSG